MEREITGPVDLCDHRGRLTPRRGLVAPARENATLRRAHGRRALGLLVRVIAPDEIVSFVYADIDYAGRRNVWILDRTTGSPPTAGTLQPFGRGFAPR